MLKKLGHTKGDAKLKFLITVVIIGVIIWIAIKLSTPYFQFKKLQSTMEYWADITMARGDFNYEDLQSNVSDIIYKYSLPIQPENDLNIYYDDYEKKLKVWVETVDPLTNTRIEGYKIDVKFPGYIYTYHFNPKAEAGFPN